MTKAELLVALKRLEDDEEVKVVVRGSVTRCDDVWSTCDIFGYEMQTRCDDSIEIWLRARREED
jgi:hypothetical protein